MPKHYVHIERRDRTVRFKYMAHDAKVSDAWIIYENHAAFEASLSEANSFLSHHNLAKAGMPEHVGSVGFVKITFC